MPPERLGIDVGGVLVKKRDLRGEDTNFSPGEAEWMPGALDAARTLRARGYELHIVSFCGARTEMETRRALHAAGFPAWIPEENWHFTRERSDKVDVMIRNGISTLVDDRRDIVAMVGQAGMRGILFGGPQYPTWHSVLAALPAIAVAQAPPPCPDLSSSENWPSLSAARPRRR